MTSLLLLPLMAAAGGHHGGGHGPRGYRNVDQWLQSLPEEQQVKARAILEEARPAIEDTRWRIRQKREELAHFDYAEDSSAVLAGSCRTCATVCACSWRSWKAACWTRWA